MAKHAAKCKPTECEECPEWIFTFADLVMLMMGFFVILWVLKPPEGKQTSGEAEKKWLETVAEIRKPFGWVPDPDSTDKVDQHYLKKNNPPEGKGGQTVDPPDSARGTEPLVMNVRPGKIHSIGGRLAFEAGSAEMTPETTRVADEIIKVIQGHRNILQVKGHASLDDLPDGAAPSKYMELSMRRAQAIADYFISKGISADVVRVQGCSTFEPVKQRAYEPGALYRNRRVEVEVSDVPVTERQDNSRPDTVPPLESLPETKPNAPASLDPPKPKAGH